VGGMIQAGAEGRVHTSHLPIRERRAKVSKKVKFQERAHILVIVGLCHPDRRSGGNGASCGFVRLNFCRAFDSFAPALSPIRASRLSRWRPRGSARNVGEIRVGFRRGDRIASCWGAAAKYSVLGKNSRCWGWGLGGLGVGVKGDLQMGAG